MKGCKLWLLQQCINKAIPAEAELNGELPAHQIHRSAEQQEELSAMGRKYDEDCFFPQFLPIPKDSLSVTHTALLAQEELILCCATDHWANCD